MSNRLDNRGWTLVSVVVAIGILVIAFTMAASSFISASRLARQTAEFTAASNFAEGVMERLAAQRYESVHSTDITAGLPPLPGVRCRVDATEREAGLKEVTVTCEWTSAGRERHARYSTLLAKGAAR